MAKVEEDLYYSENAAGKLLSISNGSIYENALTITKVEAGKIFYELAGDKDPFKTIEQVDKLDYEDFAVWCYDWYDEGAVGIVFGSQAEGYYTIAGSSYQHVQGMYNKEDKENKYAHIVGNGTSNDKRSNAHTLDWEGNAEFAGDVIANGCGGASPVSLVGIAARLGSLKFVKLTQSQYDALTTKDPNTIYFTTD